MTQKEQLAVLMEQMNQVKNQVEDLHHTVCGNGQPGLKMEVDRLKQRQSWRDWVMTIVLVPLAIAVIVALLPLVF